MRLHLYGFATAATLALLAVPAGAADTTSQPTTQSYTKTTTSSPTTITVPSQTIVQPTPPHGYATTQPGYETRQQATTETTTNVTTSKETVPLVNTRELKHVTVKYGDESIGEVERVLIAPDGSAQGAIIDVGGFMGIGEHRVLVPWSELTIVGADGDYAVISNLSAEELKARPYTSQ